MYRVSESRQSLAISEFRWVWALSCLVFLTTTALGGWQAYQAEQLGLFKGAIVVIAMAGMCVGAAVLSVRSTYEVNIPEEKLTWRRATLGWQKHGELSFRDVDHVGLETGRQTTLTLTRVVVYSEKGDVPLSRMFTGRYEENKKLASTVRKMISHDDAKADKDLIPQSVLQMLNRGQTLQATALLRRDGNMSLSEARRQVQRVLLEIQGDTVDQG